MQRPIDLATTQPGIMYRGTYSVAPGGHNIDQSSRLQHGTPTVIPKCHIDLYQRPFVTVPYLGRGAGNPLVESQLQQGDQIYNRRSESNLSERSYIKYQQTPLLPDIQQMHHPSRMIESDADQRWVRGGYDSRGATRDQP